MSFVLWAINESEAALDGFAMIDEKIMLVGNFRDLNYPPDGVTHISDYLGSEDTEMAQ